MTRPVVGLARTTTAGSDTRRAALTLHITGAVQGVGFRPAVARLARSLGLDGLVANDPAGVTVKLEGPPGALEEFVARLPGEAPAAANLEDCRRRDAAPRGAQGFVIAASRADGECRPALGPDVATCPRCLAEVLDPRDRRHRHVFASCAQCGPRFSLVEALPFDRERTTMTDFAPCAACVRVF